MNEDHLKYLIHMCIEYNQTHLIDLIVEKNPSFIASLGKVSFKTLLQQMHLITEKSLSIQGSLQPPLYQFLPDHAIAHKNGVAMNSAGKVGVILIAGGMSTRLGKTAPKGCLAVTPITHKSLFQLFMEKVAAAEKQCNSHLPIAIMTSSFNHSETLQFFKEHSFFGRAEKDISFFVQDNLPFLDADGKLIVTENNTIAEGPSGNGHALKHFSESGLLDRWEDLGVEFVQFHLIDNPLSDPFDLTLTEAHLSRGGDILIRCIKKVDPEEKLGIIALRNGELNVIEYSEMSEKDLYARGAEGDLLFNFGNISVFSFRLSFIRKIAKVELPLHKAWKNIFAKRDEPGSDEKGWKFERFIFDLIPYASGVNFLLSPREDCFAPVKNAIGNDSLETAQQALIQRDKKIISILTGQEGPALLELDPQFYYPTPDMLTVWKGKIPPNGFIASYIKPA